MVTFGHHFEKKVTIFYSTLEKDNKKGGDMPP